MHFLMFSFLLTSSDWWVCCSWNEEEEEENYLKLFLFIIIFINELSNIQGRLHRKGKEFESPIAYGQWEKVIDSELRK